jgi:hypothetical protein
MDEILLLMGMLSWGYRKATMGIYFSSHNERKDYEIENHPAVSEESEVLLGSAWCLRQ